MKAFLLNKVLLQILQTPVQQERTAMKHAGTTVNKTIVQLQGKDLAVTVLR